MIEHTSSIDSLFESWLNEVKEIVANVFTKSSKVFELYLIGELCEKLYLDTKGAKAVLEEL